jgi:ceramide glucosyltransferase
LKPLKGADPGLLRNLETFFQLDYPKYEIILSVANASDPARPVAERLIAKYSQVRARLIEGDVQIGPNPKINNLVRSFDDARNDLILISDSNIRVNRGYLKRMVGLLDANTGVVTAVVSGKFARGLGGCLESIYLNTFYARWMIFLAAFGVPTVMGKSMLFRRSDAERFGGIRALSGYLAEDHMTGQAMRYLGLKTKLMTSPVHQIIGDYSMSTFWQRHLRWGRMRKSCEPAAFWVEIVSSACITGVIGALGFRWALGWNFMAFLCAYLTLWMLSDMILMMTLETRISWKTPTHWLLRELLQIPLWLHILAGNTVKWRGGSFRLLPGSVLAVDTNFSLSTQNQMKGTNS